jgi:hypothetical protein
VKERAMADVTEDDFLEKYEAAKKRAAEMEGLRPPWTREEAAPVVAFINDAVRQHGLAAELVGSVARVGYSKKDVDVVVRPNRPLIKAGR